MENKEIIKELQRIYEASRVETVKCIRVDLLKLISLLDNDNNGWISVKEGLPEKDTPVLVFQQNEKKHLEYFVLSHDGSNWREYDPTGEDMYESLTWYDEIEKWRPIQPVATDKL